MLSDVYAQFWLPTICLCRKHALTSFDTVYRTVVFNDTSDIEDHDMFKVSQKQRQIIINIWKLAICYGVREHGLSSES